MIDEITTKEEFDKLIDEHFRIVVLYTNSNSFLKTLKIIETILDDKLGLVEKSILGPYVRFTFGKTKQIFVMRHHRKRRIGEKYPVIRLI